FGQYPWTRSLWGRVVEELAHQGTKAMLFDMVMEQRDTDPSADLGFTQVLRETGLPIYMGFASHPRAKPLPKVEPIHEPRALTSPRPAAQPVVAAAANLPEEAFPEQPDAA